MAINKCRVCSTDIIFEPSRNPLLLGLGPNVCNKCSVALEKEKAAEADKLAIASAVDGSSLEMSLQEFKDYSLEKKTKAQERALLFLNDRSRLTKTSRHPYLFGSPGTGKTSLSIYYAKKMILEHGSTVKFINIPRLLFNLKANLSTGTKAIIEDLKFGSLILDDFGAHNITNWTMEVLYNIIDSRLRSKKPVLMTSNLHPTKISEAFYNSSNGDVSKTTCEAIEDRVLELCIPIPVKGDSFRLERALRAI